MMSMNICLTLVTFQKIEGFFIKLIKNLLVK